MGLPDLVWTVLPPGRDALGRYRLHYEIGRGGMGAVYLASLTGPDGFVKRVAIKTLAAELRSDPELATMLVDEARIVSALQHPHIVQLYELAREDQAPYLVLEYVHGDTLGLLLGAARKLPAALAVWLASELCDALVSAHELRVAGQPAGLVHRDISPQNILIGYDGVPKLVDFGIARVADRGTRTEAGP